MDILRQLKKSAFWAQQRNSEDACVILQWELEKWLCCATWAWIPKDVNEEWNRDDKRRGR